MATFRKRIDVELIDRETGALVATLPATLEVLNHGSNELQPQQRLFAQLEGVVHTDLHGRTLTAKIGRTADEVSLEVTADGMQYVTRIDIKLDGAAWRSTTWFDTL